nr:LysR family transcriptional regulator [Auraticoccus cholistanensis]
MALLVAVARRGSIGAAAREVGISQQAASERLRAVERQVGVPLLRRAARGSELTEAGTVVTEWAVRLLQVAGEVDAALATLRDHRDREVRVAASMTIAEHLLPGWLAGVRQRRPGLSVSLTATNSQAVVAAVSEGRADVGFVEGADVPHQLASRDLVTDELVLVVARDDPLARRRRPLQPAQLAGLSLTSREAGSGTREVVDRALAAHGLRLAPPAVEVTTSTGAREAVRAGSGPAFLSRRTVAHELATGALVVVPTTGLDLTRTFRAVWVGGGEPPAGPVRDLVAVAQSSSARSSSGA